MISASTAIKYDVMSIRSICPITNPRAKTFLKIWAAEKLFTLLENLMFSVVVISFIRWKQKVQVMKKMQKISNYLKFQSSQRLRQWVESWIGKNLAGAFHTWANEVKAQKLAEYKAAEVIRVLQLVKHAGPRNVLIIHELVHLVFCQAAQMAALKKGECVQYSP